MGAQCSVWSATIVGVEAIPVQVEVALSSGLPGFTIVGMTDAAIQEARERIRAAIKSAGFAMPNEKIIVNLAPGSLKKRGSGFDLPIALGLLSATSQISSEMLKGRLFAGELSLSGEVKTIPGLLAYASCAQELGLELVSSYSPELGLFPQREGTLSLNHLARLRNGGFEKCQSVSIAEKGTQLDFSDIAGHDQAKRALQIAATGNHGTLLLGPPGSGKTMLASRLPSILPPLNDNEALEVAKIFSIAGEPINDALLGVRPFRSPHHSASLAGLIGGGSPLRPGEATLAHNGILFLDELPEFKPSVLQGLRQPMESGNITIVRADATVTFPARFSFIAAANPCPCGHFGDSEATCTCTLPQINSYQGRIGGPVLDRIDMRVVVGRLPASNVLRAGQGVSSAELKQGVMAGREFRSWRICKQDGMELTSRNIFERFQLSVDAQEYFEKLADRRRLSGRGIARVLSVARTIADLAQADYVSKQHICEAAGLRMEESVTV